MKSSCITEPKPMSIFYKFIGKSSPTKQKVILKNTALKNINKAHLYNIKKYDYGTNISCTIILKQHIGQYKTVKILKSTQHPLTKVNTENFNQTINTHLTFNSSKTD
jgi:hypothetical protein